MILKYINVKYIFDVFKIKNNEQKTQLYML
jgi:hypothetical protein